MSSTSGFYQEPSPSINLLWMVQGDSKINIKVFLTEGLSVTLEMCLNIFSGRETWQMGVFFVQSGVSSLGSCWCSLRVVPTQLCLLLFTGLLQKKQQKTRGKNQLLLYCTWLHRKIQPQKGQVWRLIANSSKRWKKDTSYAVEQIPERLISSVQMPTKLCANCGRELHQKAEGSGPACICCRLKQQATVQNKKIVLLDL